MKDKIEGVVAFLIFVLIIILEFMFYPFVWVARKIKKFAYVLTGGR